MSSVAGPLAGPSPQLGVVGVRYRPTGPAHRSGQVPWTAGLAIVAVLAMVAVGFEGYVWLAGAPAAPPASAAAVLPASESPATEPASMAPSTSPSVGPAVTAGALTSAPPGQPTAWTPTSALGTARWGQGTATLADGRVLVVGGTTETTSAGALASAEIFDPVTGRWQAAASMHEARAYPLVVRLADGRVLVAGGAHATHPVASTEIYDPTANAWSDGPTMTTPRSVFAGVRLLDGRILVVGGGTTASAGPAANSTEILDPATGTWVRGTPMRERRAYPTATLLADGRVLVVGGSTRFPSGGTVGGAEVFDPALNKWAETSPMIVPVYGHTADLLPDDNVLVAGGWSSTADSATSQSTSQLFDPQAGRWMTTAPMHDARADARSAVLPDGRVVVAGGLSPLYAPIASVEVYNPTTQAWTQLPPTAVAAWWGTLAVLPSGRLLVAAGTTATDGGAPTRDAEVLDLGVTP